MKTSREEYLQRLQDIQNSSATQYVMLPTDEPRFIIDSNSRKIIIPDEFTFLGLKKDTGAETIYFEVDRYFDTHDLSQNTCIVQFINENDAGKVEEGIYPVTILDVDSVPGKIIFGWTITNEVTARAGNVSFSIRFYSVDTTSSGGLTQTVFTFSWNTLAATLPVKDTLDVTGDIAATYPALLEEWQNRMQTLSDYAAMTLDQANSIKELIEEKSEDTLGKMAAAETQAEESRKLYSDFINEASAQAAALAKEVVEKEVPDYAALIERVNTIQSFVDSAKTQLESLQESADGSMQKSIYDTQNLNTDVFLYAKAKADEVQGHLDTAYKTLQDSYAKTNEEIKNAHVFNEVEYDALSDVLAAIENALDSCVDTSKAYAEKYAQAMLADYKAFTTTIVEELPELGTPMTFYLVKKDSGYEKYWWVEGADGEYTWDSFGSSSTLVLESLPETGAEDVDYIVKAPGGGDGYYYYKWINGKWQVVAGSSMTLITATTDEEGNKVDGVLPETGSSFTDYYRELANGSYQHYRWINGAFVIVGGDVSQDPAFIALKTLAETDSSNLKKAQTNIDANTTNINALSNSLTNLQQTVAGIDTEGYTYEATLTKDEETGNYVYTLYETKLGNTEVKSQFILPSGGGGGTTSTTNLVVDKITPSPVIAITTDKIELKINYSSTDADGESVDGSYKLKLGNTQIMSGQLAHGENTFDVTDKCSVGTQKFTLTVTDEGGSVAVKTWNVQVVDVRIESSFSDKYTFDAGRSVNFTYTPYGAVSKTVHFKLDGVEIGTLETAASGALQSYTIPAQEHGTHLLECWITATISGKEVETTHIFKDIIWYDSTSTVPVISCIYRNDYYGTVQAKQYDSTGIVYTVYDPSTVTPRVTLSVDDNVVSTLTLSENTNTWTYKTAELGEHTLKITCGETYVVIVVNIAELGIKVEPITANLDLDFNPNGMSNSGDSRLWSYTNEAGDTYGMAVSDNFDWSNGGYQVDDEGNQYFCIKAGTRATIDYKLFKNDPTLRGQEFKIIYKTTNVRSADARWLECLDTTQVSNVVDGGTVVSDITVGLEMNVHNAYLHSNSDSLYMPYSEDDIIELEYNINTIDRDDTNATALVMSYEDGVGFRPMIYSNGIRFYQYNPKDIVIGSDDCDVYIYRMKIYSASLTDSNILSNFIADARDAETMISRYNRNQIYDENNALTPDSVANACPHLRVLKIECPHFTNDKKDYVRDTSFECIYKNGDPILDNWKFINCYHAGQGTTSNEYGYAGRNIDVICCFDGIHQVVSKIPLDSSYVTELTLGDGTKYSDGTGKIALTRESVPNNWWNIKVNIASSENANNALLAKRFNDYLPYTSLGKQRDPYVKNTMEFVNCVVFLKESDPDISTHREFTDTEWHKVA